LCNGDAARDAGQDVACDDQAGHKNQNMASGTSHASGAWSPFRHPDFALLWTAALVSNTGSWMHDAAAGWLMTTLAPTPIMVALVQAATTLPVFLLALPAGALADRADRRRLMMLVQACMLVLAALLGALVLTKSVNEGWLLAITFGLGMGTAISVPTWQAILPQLVPRTDLPPAVALHAVGINLSRAIGPAVGGLLIQAIGIAWPFLFNAATFLAIIFALWHWRPTSPAPVTGARESLFKSIRVGVMHAAENLTLRNTLLRSVAFYIFGSTYWALLPLVARQQLGGDATLFGILLGCIGIGAVTGALGLPRLRARFGLDGTLIAGTLGTALAMLGYGLLRSPWLGMATSLLAGASWIAALSSLNIAAQMAVADWIRARGMALYSTVFYGSLAAGSVLWGRVATVLTIPTTLLLAAAGALLTLPLARWYRLTKRAD
jgi:predicted MFS family arabinose efflux permease